MALTVLVCLQEGAAAASGGERRLGQGQSVYIGTVSGRARDGDVMFPVLLCVRSVGLASPPLPQPCVSPGVLSAPSSDTPQAIQVGAALSASEGFWMLTLAASLSPGVAAPRRPPAAPTPRDRAPGLGDSPPPLTASMRPAPFCGGYRSLCVSGECARAFL